MGNWRLNVDLSRRSPEELEAGTLAEQNSTLSKETDHLSTGHEFSSVFTIYYFCTIWSTLDLGKNSGSLINSLFCGNAIL